MPVICESHGCRHVGKRASRQAGTQASRQAGRQARQAVKQAYSFSRMVLYCQFSKQGYGRVYQLSEVLFFMGCLHFTKCSACTPRSHEHNSRKYKSKSYTQRSSYMYRSTLPHLMSPPPPPPCKDKKFHIRRMKLKCDIKVLLLVQGLFLLYKTSMCHCERL